LNDPSKQKNEAVAMAVVNKICGATFNDNTGIKKKEETDTVL